MSSALSALYITAGALEVLYTLLIAVKTFYRPKKIFTVLLLFSLLTLPASVVNILEQANIVPMHWNSFAYLTSTLFVMALHYWLSLDIAKHLRVGGVNYKSRVVMAGTITLVGSMICLSTQIVILLVRNDPYPVRPAFITGVILSIICGSATYIYSFSTLVHFKSQRFHEGQSKTTAIGVWFLMIRLVYYTVYGILYVWFFIVNSWDFFSTLLVFDYVARFVLCLLYTWSPPKFVIEYMAGRFSSGISDRENNNEDHKFSAFTITEAKDSYISTDDHQKFHQNYIQDDQHINNLHCIREDILHSGDVDIVAKP